MLANVFFCCCCCCSDVLFVEIVYNTCVIYHISVNLFVPLYV